MSKKDADINEQIIADAWEEIAKSTNIQMGCKEEQDLWKLIFILGYKKGYKESSDRGFRIFIILAYIIAILTAITIGSCVAVVMTLLFR